LAKICLFCAGLPARLPGAWPGDLVVLARRGRAIMVDMGASAGLVHQACPVVWLSVQDFRLSRRCKSSWAASSMSLCRHSAAR
jgi:hypothetical protein